MAVRAEQDITLTRVDDGAAGANGATFTPSVDAAGDISWTNDGGLPNPQTQNIMGPAGSSGVSVTGVKTQYYLSTSDSSATGGSWNDTPQTFVSGKYYWTRDYIDYSDGTHDTSTPVYNQGLTLANEYAMSASDAADNASEYAARALGNLSTVQSITETLNWITAHGTMTLTSDVALDPTHVYFVVDAGGDYTVGGTTYAIVTEPDVSDIGTYYELTIDESLNNYVGTHLALDGEGLWLLPAASGTNKVLVAHGNGSTYTTAGTYIIDSGGTTVASFRANGATIGIDDGTESYLGMDYHSLQLVDKGGNVYFHVSDLRDSSGNAAIVETFTGDGTTKNFTTSIYASNSLVVDVDGVTQTVNTDYTYDTTSWQIKFVNAPSDGSTITATYNNTTKWAKAYTAGLRASGTFVAPLSFVEGGDNEASGYCAHAEGYGNEASGRRSHVEGKSNTASGNDAHAEGNSNVASGKYSHAEGEQTTASGFASHAEGYNTVASNDYSHAQNVGTIASSRNQTAIGKYNEEDNNGTYAAIIGNGTADNARSNALTVNWNGNVFIALDTNAGTSTTDGNLYSAINNLGWASDVIV